MEQVPISVCMIAKNEEQFIGGCLEKLIPYGLEIVVVDTGSTDKTVEIAKQYTENIYSFEWINDFSAARNFAASKASHDWIIALDCDEYLEELDIEELIRILPQHKREVGSITIKNVLAKGSESFAVHRIYHRKNAHFEEPIHEQIRNDKHERPGNFEAPMTILHYGYALSPEKMKQKQERNLSLLLQELSKNEKEPYYYFQIARSYAVLQKREDAFEYLEKGMALNPDIREEYVPHMILDYGKSLLELRRYEEAMTVEKWSDSLGHISDYRFLMGRIYFANDQFLKALQSFLKATTAKTVFAAGTNSFLPLHAMAIIYQKLGENEMAKNCEEQARKLAQQNQNHDGRN